MKKGLMLQIKRRRCVSGCPTRAAVVVGLLEIVSRLTEMDRSLQGQTNGPAAREITVAPATRVELGDDAGTESSDATNLNEGRIVKHLSRTETMLQALSNKASEMRHVRVESPGPLSVQHHP